MPNFDQISNFTLNIQQLKKRRRKKKKTENYYNRNCARRWARLKWNKKSCAAWHKQKINAKKCKYQKTENLSWKRICWCCFGFVFLYFQLAKVRNQFVRAKQFQFFVLFNCRAYRIQCQARGYIIISNGQQKKKRETGVNETRKKEGNKNEILSFVGITLRFRVMFSSKLLSCNVC